MTFLDTTLSIENYLVLRFLFFLIALNVLIGLPNELDNLFDIPGRYVTEESGNSNVGPLGFFCFTATVALPVRSTLTCTLFVGDLCFGGDLLSGGEFVITLSL
jgi:hypothetical protein